MTNDDWKSEMRDADENSAAGADEELASQLEALSKMTTADREALKPKVSDQQAYVELLEEIRKSTARNESVGQLVARVKTLGEGASSVLGSLKVLI